MIEEKESFSDELEIGLCRIGKLFPVVINT